MLHNERLTFIKSEGNYIVCDACSIITNGFMYRHEDTKLDVWCSLISEPFLHLVHFHHPLYNISPDHMN